VGSISMGLERGPERAPPPEDPTVNADDFIRCLPAILKPTPFDGYGFRPIRHAARTGAAGFGKIFEQYLLVGRFFDKVV